MMSKLKINDLKKYLKLLDRQQLEKEIISIVKTHSEIQDYYFAKLNPDNEDLLEKYKKIVEKEFNPRSREILRYPVIKKAIKDFSKLTTNQEQVIDIMLFTVDCGIDFTNTFGDIDQKFYHTIASIYDQAVAIIVKHEKDDYIEWCHKLMVSSQDIGWGFGFDMSDIYNEAFGHLEEDRSIT